ncbi:MAG: glycosyltransferase, partial [Cyanobacteria bacterium]|nr:glycosyltransferase [Cyanobacteriota bacterium]MDW8201930.1 glycosyltransferase [Cyanobacteriota bacterium SKYGB_h_bin112]
MKILQINTIDNLGGAARLAWQLFQGYQQLGYESSFVVAAKYSHHPTVVGMAEVLPNHAWFQACMALRASLQAFNGKRLGAGRLQLLLTKLSRPLQLITDPIWRIRSQLGHEDFHAPATWHLLRKFQPDIIHCHNLHGSGFGRGYFDLRALAWLSRRCPIVLSLHDAWLLSGHCAHSFECDRWRTGCGSCPDLTIPPPIPRDATAYNWQRKQQIYARSRLYVATPC